MLILILIVVCIFFALFFMIISKVFVNKWRYRWLFFIVGFFIPFIDIPFVKLHGYYLCKKAGLQVYQVPEKVDSYYLREYIFHKGDAYRFPNSIEYIEYGPTTDAHSKRHNIYKRVNLWEGFSEQEIDKISSKYEVFNGSRLKKITYAIHESRALKIINRSDEKVLVETLSFWNTATLGWVMAFLNIKLEKHMCPVDFNSTVDQFYKIMGG